MPVGERRACEWAGCCGEGAYRAPQSRRELGHFRWFCLDHVRAYNAAWNYYAGMTEAEVEADVRMDTVWRRPTWRFGSPEAEYRGHRLRIDDGFGESNGNGEGLNGGSRRCRPMTETERALLELELSPPVTVAVVKAQYKVLVKRHHPDANGGAKEAEERFKRITEAYRVVMGSLTS